jgi:hypothetical protein
MDQWALLLKLMTELRQYRPERPPATITRPAAKGDPKSVSSADRKLLDEYAKAVERCGTGRLILDEASKFYVPELSASCLSGKVTEKKQETNPPAPKAN